ncbi:MAG: hypothetical protein ACXWDL_15780, partial [Nocardioides sp.]
AGAWSIRLAVLAAGFGASWLLADVFGASTSTALLVSAAGALIVFLLSLVMSKLMFFFVGAVIGAVVGAKLFVVLDGGDASVLLAVVFVPAVAFLFAFLAQRWSRRFLAWATAFGGAAIALTGLGRLAPEQLDALYVPEDATERTLMALAWLALGLLGRWVQLRLPNQD